MTFHSVLASPTPISQEPFWTTVEQQSKGAKGKITSWMYKLVLLKQSFSSHPIQTCTSLSPPGIGVGFGEGFSQGPEPGNVSPPCTACSSPGDIPTVSVEQMALLTAFLTRAFSSV